MRFAHSESYITPTLSAAGSRKLNAGTAVFTP
jgi:hypothetical protein